jgi:hypothetical protein
MKQTGILTLLVLCIGMVSSCYYDKSELVYPPNNNPCDTSDVSYQNDIVNILSTNCYACHGGDASSGSGIKLDSYNNVKMMSLAIVPVIQHDPGFTQMPKGGSKLSDCNIAKIRTWVRNGSPNN